jgi:hypothetical protein
MSYRKARPYERPSFALANARVTLLFRAEDMKWLREVHLPELPEEYKTAVLYGNEDCPLQIECYHSLEPLVTDWPSIWILEE